MNLSSFSAWRFDGENRTTPELSWCSLQGASGAGMVRESGVEYRSCRCIAQFSGILRRYQLVSMSGTESRHSPALSRSLTSLWGTSGS